jgi:hypothetical protein
MQSRARYALALTLAFASSACALLGFGPATSHINGWVYSVEQQTPLRYAEVCLFGVDTTCVRTDAKGYYELTTTAQTAVLRFRYGSLTPAASDPVTVVPPARYTVSCALSNRMVLADRPVPCQPIPAR